ncbi:beta-ketoacyl synthase N-terminal-like domain-containing protein [Niabella ginsengisoli]|uniref:Beta-ketoacyl synthase n=1 Tax=Niabella ginsengisoli TaxID=522298 RepID=A0ABS9SNN5_9BACT|nr:beta-ketoacyl synthase N-terminal-like domain-containing protein [Niabella ginsengisoli]MCH5599886.1 beta-ketoacyl synthase [Niabella ginsengisoli]
MSHPVFVVADNIVSALGFTSAENFSQLLKGASNVQQHAPGNRSPQAFYGSLFPETFWEQHTIPSFTKFESLLAISIKDALNQANINPANSKTGLIISSTKGNISLLEDNEVSDTLKQEIGLSSSAKKIAAHFGFQSQPVIISHACISGLVALITAKRMLQAGLFDHIVVAGADIITRFILSGFQSFQAVADELCKPFDVNRKGINLGEAASTIILSVNKPVGNDVIQLTGGAVSNDANHISGPSRTGHELFIAVKQAIEEAGISKEQIDFISLHGTATLYNDDMESKAIRLAGLQSVPVNSLKGYYGHTLGAAGLVESVISMHSLQQNIIIPTKGFETPGTAEIMNVCSTLQHTHLNCCLKTASGFGGCNAAVVFEKVHKLEVQF